jgi:hypothetical protein
MTEPHYETLELRVPEEERRQFKRRTMADFYAEVRLIGEAEQRRRHRRWLWFAVLFTALLIVVIAQLASAPSGASEPPGTAPALRGAPHPALIVQRLGSPPVERMTGVRLSVGAPLRGYASWYDVASGHAAAGPLLRTGDWRGRAVTVCAGRRCVTVVTDDWCACGSRHGIPTLIDLARSDFARLAPPSSGIVLVTVRGATLPPTDVAP